VKLVPILAATCGVLVCACGGSGAETPARPASASPTASSKPAPHIIAANKTCMAAQPAFDRARERIDRAGEVLKSGAKGAERRRQLKRSRDGWRLRHATMADLFTQLRELQEVGADKRYDTFLAAWGKTLSTVESVAENTGGDQKELETSFGALTVFADELAAAMVDANVAFCDPFMPVDEPDASDG
jgi:hypothetical protein